MKHCQNVSRFYHNQYNLTNIQIESHNQNVTDLTETVLIMVIPKEINKKIDINLGIFKITTICKTNINNS